MAEAPARQGSPMPPTMRPTMPLPTAALDAEEIGELRRTIAEAATAADYPAAVRGLEGGSAGDRDLWRTLAEDIGLAGVGLPEEVGGLGGLAELLAVAEELGASLAAVPFLASTVLSGQTLAAAGPDASPWLEQVVAGAVIAPALVDERGGVAVDGGTVVWDPASETVSGAAPFVLFGAEADAWLISASGPDGPALVVVDAGASGSGVAPLPSLDFSRPLACVTFDATPATTIAQGDAARTALHHGETIGLLAVAADQLGGAQRAFDMTLDYIGLRRQFNREIGSFQAVKHRMADALGLVEMARSALARVLWDEPGPRAERLALDASVAKAWCSPAYQDVVAEAIQLHGGVGFTWEHDAHLYFRRARFDAAYLGDAQTHRDRIGTLQGW